MKLCLGKHMGLWNVSMLGGSRKCKEFCAPVSFIYGVSSKSCGARKKNKHDPCLLWVTSVHKDSHYLLVLFSRQHRLRMKCFLFISRRKFTWVLSASSVINKYPCLCQRATRKPQQLMALTGRKKITKASVTANEGQLWRLCDLKCSA